MCADLSTELGLHEEWTNGGADLGLNPGSTVNEQGNKTKRRQDLETPIRELGLNELTNDWIKEKKWKNEWNNE